MMTLYVVFEAIENGEISLDTEVRISRNAASEPPSKLGLRAGQRIRLRYLIRAAAVKSANDAATALGEAIEGSEAAFARRMNRTALALGMTRTTFRNAHGLTESGHLSTARDMTNLGRRLFYHYPQYYNLFSRRSTNAGIREVRNTNRRLLGSYRGADGIKTGYTNAAGFNLVASAERGQERIIATVFGGRSSATRNARVAELLDMGFRRANTRVAVNAPPRPQYGNQPATPSGATTRVATAVVRSLRPAPRPVQEPAQDLMIALESEIQEAIETAQQDGVQVAEAPAETPEETAAEPIVTAGVTPVPRPETAAAPVALAAIEPETIAEPEAESDPTALAIAAALAEATAGVEQATAAQTAPETAPAEQVTLASVAPTVSIQPEPRIVPEDPIVVTRVSTSGGRHWGVNVGRYGSRYQAERVLLRTALKEMSTLDGTLRRVVRSPQGFDANFMGMSQETADLACRRLQARSIDCTPIGPS